MSEPFKDKFQEMLDTNPFIMRPREAMKASEQGLCGICGKKIDGESYHDTVFIRQIWGPPSMSLESSGYHMPIKICSVCQRKNLESNAKTAKGVAERAERLLKEYDSSTGTPNKEDK